ncbi:hypothetical protein J3458_018771 [Metarhizium acridum]|uniref:DUF167 domain protein n=1 Tax=Metarhizium acridum (strain CQMa 102) TaxID=655827 RepID=E9E477_METAQ|nr:DUF167 domain protein [Metarhizium acridum CQMa 102]EFY89294.1 DUF167 domain protein [Metarhizium acridum CQMa 102]KAG8409683.1 hypothetical protein J3458_018771 [Metarhizium acridum]
MASPLAARFIASKSGSLSVGFVQLQLRVKAGTSKDREGILAVTDRAIELCVTAQPRHGEANKAVVQALSNAIGIPKSRFRFVSGLKSRDKVVAIGDIQGDGPDYTETVLRLLREASYRTLTP